jgi:hypothetical protein
LKFGPLFARELRRRRAVDDEGEVLNLLVQRRRDRAAAVKLMRKLLKKRFTLSYRDVEDLLAERGLGVSYETVRT